jgi:hypothetical protein
MMEINKLSKYHDENEHIAQEMLRQALTGLNSSNLGERIGNFYNFLLAERGRLLHEGKSSNMIVAARNSAFIISLFAYWLDPEGQPIVYYDSLRKGLFTLIKAELLPAPPHIHMGPNTVEILSAIDHDACLTLINDLANHEPALRAHRYWIEYFCLWITQHIQEPSAPLIKETDQTSILALAPARTQISTTGEKPKDYTIELPSSQQNKEPSPENTVFIKHEPLHPTPEPLLSRLIQEVQRSILVDEVVIRHIYHSLLAGHVILSGPPGTGKTDLARIIPEILWCSEMKKEEADETAAGTDEAELDFDTRTAYTTRLVTATDEWSVRTLISGIAPQSKNGTISYTMQYGFLTTTILKNWSFYDLRPEEWSQPHRTMVVAPSGIERSTSKTFRGQWLVIDEFNRAPIDIAFGDALTAIGGNDVLRVAIEGGSAELPIPQDFRIIGTLNSFDRNYLNQISEALKRRFSFIEILPPSRTQRSAEQGIVLYKALKSIRHLNDTIKLDEDNEISWQISWQISQQDYIVIGSDASGVHSILWENNIGVFRAAFDNAWRLFEVIRIYRQLGTAQAISLFRHMLITGILQGYTTTEEWVEQALDAALCDTIADQLQVLMPDEIEVLLSYLTTERASFANKYHEIIRRLASSRIYAQLLALGGVIDDQGQPFLRDEQIEQIVAADTPQVPAPVLSELFHLNSPLMRLPHFTRRLRVFKAERGL